MHLINLRTFITVSRTGGFHSAAERLNITQAAVSARIKALEDHLGQRLLERGRSGATLSEAGHQLLPHAVSIVRNWSHATSMLGVPTSRTVELRIGAQFSIWAQFILDWAAWIAGSLPEIRLQLSFDFNSDMLKAVQDGRLDIAITPATTSEQGVHMIPLAGETMVLVARRPVRLNDDNVPVYVRLDWGPQINSQITRVEPRLPDSKLSIGNGMMGLRYILEHDACGYLPLRTAAQLLQQKQLYRVKRAPSFKTTGLMVYSEDNSNHLFIERAIEGFLGTQSGHK